MENEMNMDDDWDTAILGNFHMVETSWNRFCLLNAEFLPRCRSKSYIIVYTARKKLQGCFLVWQLSFLKEHQKGSCVFMFSFAGGHDKIQP